MTGNFGLAHYCPCGEPWAVCQVGHVQDQSAPDHVIGSNDQVETRLDKLRAQLVDTAGLDTITDPVPLIPGIIYRDSLTWLYGAPGSYKSFVALDIAGCAATGESWQGYGATQPGPVLYLVAEGVSGIRRRVRAWEKATGNPMVGVQFLPVAVQAALAGDWDVLADLVAELRPVLVVIDTQARVTAGMEENSAKEMGDFVRRVDQLRAVCGSCILTIHHTGRNGEHLRGSIAIDGAATTTIKVIKEDDRVTLKCSKQKDAEEFDDIALRAVPMGDSIILALAGNRPIGDVKAMTPWRGEWWAQHRDEWVSPATLIRTGIVGETAFHRAKYALLNAGLVGKEGTGRSTRYRLLQDPAFSNGYHSHPKGWGSGGSDSHLDARLPESQRKPSDSDSHIHDELELYGPTGLPGTCFTCGKTTDRVVCTECEDASQPEEQ